ncbi:TPR-like protein [Lactarius pseudohatsudake]|nr:TPR-like protein [Lactarius pseudohatsudake]
MLQGNAHFRKGEYRKAIKEYEAAITINGPSPAYLSNMAAAWLKLEEYDSAEHCAQRALCLDPRFAKARYRRGLARKGNLQLAAAVVGALTRGASYLDDRATETVLWFIHADFAAVLVQDPESTEASKALDETFTLISERNKEETVVEEDSHPTLIDQGKELESVSDSSDWNHEGNGFPCRYYNHDGCTRGVECEFSHAPDHKSVRDRLGRNVCVQFLFGECRFGSCVYSHDKAYLPSGRWWDDDQKLADVSLEYAAHRSRGRKSRGGQGRGGGRGCGRAENWGFTDDEVQELLCQGVKPWDDDAHVSVIGLITSLYS